MNVREDAGPFAGVLALFAIEATRLAREDQRYCLTVVRRWKVAESSSGSDWRES